MRVLIIGSGGRCHAIAWKIRQSSHLEELYVAPGNAGMKDFCHLVNIDVLDNEALCSFAISHQIDLTIVGPEAALMNGVVDYFEAHGLKIFGPNKLAAIIEGSKEYAKDLMKKYDIPTAKYEVFDDYTLAMDYLHRAGVPIVIKYDGLAAGKGVVVAHDINEAEEALKDMLLLHKYGDSKVVIEEYLEGPEFSLMAFVHHDKVYPLDIAQDHKRAYDGDLGPNTGGMGAYSPVPFISKEVVSDAVSNIMEKTARALVKEGRPFVGILYGGLMLTKEGPKVIEFNARFGDPETEVVLPRLKNDLLEVIQNVIMGVDVSLSFEDNCCLGVVLASKGYPNSYEKNYPILGDFDKAFHMGTKFSDGMFYTNGGRVLFVIGKGKTMKEAQADAYQNVSKIFCENLFYRHDIGYQVIRSEDK